MSASSRPHVHYVAAVVDELARHGLQVSDWDLDAGPPLAGYMQLAGAHDREGGEVRCGWCEERGWFLGRGDDGFAGGFERIRRVGGVVLPAPRVIAEELARALATMDPPLIIRGDDQRYRASDDAFLPVSGHQPYGIRWGKFLRTSALL
ncbi:MAG: DUF6292 family protein [Pseudonocardia sp.]